MTCPTRFATADEIAIAIVTACRLTGGDPIAAVRGASAPAAGWYALEALQATLPGLNCMAAARGLGLKVDGKHLSTRMRAYRATKKFRADWVDEIIGALTCGMPASEPAADTCEIDLTRAPILKRALAVNRAPAIPPRPRPEPTKHRPPVIAQPAGPASTSSAGLDLHYRPDPPPHRRQVDVVTADIMGDPIPGRSALDQRQRGI
jgi:hypothetical protein